MPWWWGTGALLEGLRTCVDSEVIGFSEFLRVSSLGRYCTIQITGAGYKELVHRQLYREQVLNSLNKVLESQKAHALIGQDVGSGPHNQTFCHSGRRLAASGEGMARGWRKRWSECH